jgi:hypothetical protein
MKMRSERITVKKCFSNSQEDKSVVIKKSALIQYTLLYLMMVFNGGIMYTVLMSELPSVITILMYAIVAFGFLSYLFKRSKYGNPYCIIITVILTASVVIVRYISGGVGIAALVEYLTCIMLPFLALCVDKNRFVERVIDAVCLFAVISVVCYFVQIAAPEVLQSVLKPFNSSFSYNDWSAAAYGGNAVKRFYMAWGRLFFTMREQEMTRNLGIYTEPGNYQIVLNSAMYMLLFVPTMQRYSIKQFKRRFFVLSSAVLTCQSTSGYLILFALILCYFLGLNKMSEMSAAKGTISAMVFVAIGILVVDYFIRGSGSLLNHAFFSKLFSDGSIDVNASTGYYRIGSIATAFATMLSHPFGVGFDRLFSNLQNNFTGAAGGALASFGAALGMIPFISTILWHIRPIVRNRRVEKSAKVAFVILFLQATMAQSKVFYPFIVAIVLIFEIERGSGTFAYGIETKHTGYNDSNVNEDEIFYSRVKG